MSVCEHECVSEYASMCVSVYTGKRVNAYEHGRVCDRECEHGRMHVQVCVSA